MRMKKIFLAGVSALVLCACMMTACRGEASPSSVPENEIAVSETEETTGGLPAENTPEETEVAENYDPSVTGTYEDGSTPVFSDTKLKLTVDGEEVVIAMYDNTAVDAFLERLPLEELSFYDLSGVEKPIERLEEPLSLGEEEPGYDPVPGEMVIYRPWANFTIFYGDFRYSSELVPLGKVESGLEILSSKTDDFTGTLERIENE